MLSGESIVCRENDTGQDMKKKKKTRIGLILRENENEFSTIEREFLRV